MDPITLSAIVGIAGTAVSGFTAYQQGQYQAKVAEANQEIANQNALRSLERSRIEAQDQDTMTLAAIGEQLSLQGASGLSTDSRSALGVRKTAKELGRRDTLNVRQAGQIEAYNYRTQGMNFAAEAAGDKLAATGGLLNSFMSAGSILGNAYANKSYAKRFAARPYSAPSLLATRSA